MELLQIGIFERFVAANTPQKISYRIEATFFGRKKIWTHANPFTELGARGYPGASVWRGGSPSPNFPAYSQLGEMPHMHS